MKIRIKENSVRLRLTKSEVAEFCKSQSYSQTINFGNRTLLYTLYTRENEKDYKALYEGDEIKIILPHSDIDKWKQDSCIGFEHQIDLDDGQKLRIKVEKDFVCLDETTEDQSDNYTNPRMINE